MQTNLFQRELATYKKKKTRGGLKGTSNNTSKEELVVEPVQKSSFMMTQKEVDHLLSIEKAKQNAPRGIRMVSSVT
jgi:predicted protein tyrosine phosphatase